MAVDFFHVLQLVASTILVSTALSLIIIPLTLILLG